MNTQIQSKISLKNSFKYADQYIIYTIPGQAQVLCTHEVYQSIPEGVQIPYT